MKVAGFALAIASSTAAAQSGPGNGPNCDCCHSRYVEEEEAGVKHKFPGEYSCQMEDESNPLAAAVTVTVNPAPWFTTKAVTNAHLEAGEFGDEHNYPSFFAAVRTEPNLTSTSILRAYLGTTETQCSNVGKECQMKTLVDPPTSGDSAKHHSSELPGSCGSHDNCGVVPPEPMAMLMDALSANKFAAALEVLDGNPDKLYVNEERGLVQVLNCSGTVVRQFEVDASALATYRNKQSNPLLQFLKSFLP